MVAHHGVVDQALVGLEHVGVLAGLVQRELQAELLERHARTRLLPVEGKGQLRGVGQVEGQVVGARGPDARTVGEHRLGRLAERDGDDAFSAAELLAGAQIEGHAGPAPVVDLDLERNEGLRIGVGRDAGDVAVAVVLPPHDLGHVERAQRAEDLVLLLTDGAGLKRRGRFHGHETQDLEEVGDHHVLEGAGRLVERNAVVDTERLGHVDLYMVDVVPVPDGLEQTVGEAEGQNVQDAFLTEEMVDAEDLVLVEDLVQHVVQRHGAGQVGAERLLHDDP